MSKRKLNYFFSSPGISPVLLWDTGKAYIGGLIILYTGIKRNSRKEQRKLEPELNELQTNNNSSPSVEPKNDIQLP